jgi:hypothetical protein
MSKGEVGEQKMADFAALIRPTLERRNIAVDAIFLIAPPLTKSKPKPPPPRAGAQVLDGLLAEVVSEPAYDDDRRMSRRRVPCLMDN